MLPWPGYNEGTFRTLSRAVTCPSVYHTRWRLHSIPFNAEHQAGNVHTNFYGLWLDRIVNRTRVYRFSN